MSLVSIIMNCRNSAKYLREALNSVYRQTFKDFEIIFWDNQSTDDSGKIAQSYGEPLKYYRGEKFLPLGAARNKAIEKASGKYIAFLDCDDIWLPEKLEKQVALLETNKALGLVYSDCYIIDSAGNAAEKTYFFNKKPLRGMVFKELIQANPIPLLAAIITKEAFNKAGAFNPRYEISEEYDLWLRIAEFYPIDFIEQSLAKYRVHSGSITINNIGLSYQEEIEIVDSWLKIKPGLKRELGNKVRRRKMRMAWFLTVLGQVCHNRNRKSLQELKKIFRYFPFSH